MDLPTLITQWSGKLPPGFVPPATRQTGLAECVHKRCRNKVAIKSDGTPAHACQNCLDRRARSCKRRRAALVAEGGCCRCAYRNRLASDFLPRGPRPGTRAEALRRPRRGCHRRVRGTARQGAPREQPRHRRLALERTPAARTLRNRMVRPAPRRTASTGHNCVSNSTIRGNEANQ